MLECYVTTILYALVLILKSKLVYRPASTVLFVNISPCFTQFLYDLYTTFSSCIHYRRRMVPEKKQAKLNQLDFASHMKGYCIK